MTTISFSSKNLRLIIEPIDYFHEAILTSGRFQPINGRLIPALMVRVSSGSFSLSALKPGPDSAEHNHMPTAITPTDQPMRTHMMMTLFLTLLLIFSIVKPAVACGIVGIMFIHTSLQLRRLRHLSSSYLDRQLSVS
ncbi:hypothetical protein ACTRXD_09850 [Nitrospira sp. T9]|uniref:hypothetical protein n=1 Tax=unclassified Nitrospira TaxID=2652172 RepID=UPI003F9BF6AA